ncbi:MAG: UbiX family flavin prenyltransferase [Deltaproteobacteria bacterium]|nr:UbiX family flavin prenyltransferase [Deltaproteobacteria bacterium]
MPRNKKKIILGITGATGVIYGVKMLETMHKKNVEIHLVITEAGLKNIEIETSYKPEDIKKLAAKVYDIDDLTAPIASGSCITDGMVVIPCTIKTLSAIANSFNYNLLVRAADVTLKERRRLVLVVRETPLHEGHLELMLKVTRMGGIVMPPVPSFYHSPKSIDDIISQTIGKILDLFGVDAHLFERWGNNFNE